MASRPHVDRASFLQAQADALAAFDRDRAQREQAEEEEQAEEDEAEQSEGREDRASSHDVDGDDEDDHEDAEDQQEFDAGSDEGDDRDDQPASAAPQTIVHLHRPTGPVNINSNNINTHHYHVQPAQGQPPKRKRGPAIAEHALLKAAMRDRLTPQCFKQFIESGSPNTVVSSQTPGLPGIERLPMGLPWNQQQAVFRLHINNCAFRARRKEITLVSFQAVVCPFFLFFFFLFVALSVRLL